MRPHVRAKADAAQEVFALLPETQDLGRRMDVAPGAGGIAGAGRIATVGLEDGCSAHGGGESSARKRDVRGKEIVNLERRCEGDGGTGAGAGAGSEMEGLRPNVGGGLEGGLAKERRIGRQAAWRALGKQVAGEEVEWGNGGGGDLFDSLPDHLLTEVLVRVSTADWPAVACVQKRWARLFKGDALWKVALARRWPRAGRGKRWPGPIGRGSTKRQYTALHVSKSMFLLQGSDDEGDEVAGHVYLFLKEQLESSPAPLSYALLHGTIIDQFLACGKAGDVAHELASKVWLAVLDNLDESDHTFRLLMRIAQEWEVFLPYPYSKSQAVQWKLFERLFTDFRDCLTQLDYFDVLTRAKHKFDLIPPAWLGY